MRYHKHLFQTSVDALNSIFFEDRHADKCIEFYLKKNRKWGSRDRRFFAETVYDCVRWWRLYLHLSSSNPEKPVNMSILAPSLWKRGLERPDFEEFPEKFWDQLPKRYDEVKDPDLKESYPQWLYNYMTEKWSQWNEMASWFNETNDLVVRVNTSRTSVENVLKELAKEDVQAKRLPGTEAGLIFDRRINIFQNPVFKNGWVEVQDGASQNVASFLDLKPGMRVIDACAGAGGKSLHIADLLDNKGKVISLDIHQWKLDQLKLRARRNNFNNIEMKCIDSSKVIKRMKDSADRVLLDVPCSGLGVLRRNPDTKWKLSESRIEELKEIQKDILFRYSEMLKPGGKMIYATCSVLPDENEKQVEKFLEQKLEFSLLKQKWYYPTRPGFDGFYMALLEKKVPGPHLQTTRG